MMAPSASQFLLNAQGNDLATWISISIGGLGLLYLLLRPKGKKLRDPLSGGLNFNLSQQRSVERQMENLLVELSNMARQITAQLDTRAAKLEMLLKEADDKLLALNRALTPAATREPRDSGAEPVRGTRAAAQSTPVHPPAAGPDDRYAEVYSLADEGHSSPEIARRLGQPAGEVELILALRPR